MEVDVTTREQLKSVVDDVVAAVTGRVDDENVGVDVDCSDGGRCRWHELVPRVMCTLLRPSHALATSQKSNADKRVLGINKDAAPRLRCHRFESRSWRMWKFGVSGNSAYKKDNCIERTSRLRIVAILNHRIFFAEARGVAGVDVGQRSQGQVCSVAAVWRDHVHRKHTRMASSLVITCLLEGPVHRAHDFENGGSQTRVVCLPRVP